MDHRRLRIFQEQRNRDIEGGNYTAIYEQTQAISGKLQILKPENGFIAINSVNITFSIINTGDTVEFTKGDAYNRIHLEVESLDKTFEV